MDLIDTILKATPRSNKQINLLNQFVNLSGLKIKSYLMTTDDYDKSKVEETKRRNREEAERFGKTASNNPRT